jgi:hypothetical protein
VGEAVGYFMNQHGGDIDSAYFKNLGYIELGVGLPIIVIYLIAYIRSIQRITGAFQAYMEPYYSNDDLEIFNDKCEAVDDLDDDVVNEKRIHPIYLKDILYVDIPDETYKQLNMRWVDDPDNPGYMKQVSGPNDDQDEIARILNDAMVPANLVSLFDKKGIIRIPDGRDKYYYVIPLPERSIWKGHVMKDGINPTEYVKAVFALPCKIEQTGQRWMRIKFHGFTGTTTNGDKWNINYITELTDHLPLYDVESCEFTRRNKMRTYKSFDIQHGPSRIFCGLYINEVHANEGLRKDKDALEVQNEQLLDKIDEYAGLRLSAEMPDEALKNWEKARRKIRWDIPKGALPAYLLTALIPVATTILFCLLWLHAMGIF